MKHCAICGEPLVEWPYHTCCGYQVKFTLEPHEPDNGFFAHYHPTDDVCIVPDYEDWGLREAAFGPPMPRDIRR